MAVIPTSAPAGAAAPAPGGTSTAVPAATPTPGSEPVLSFEDMVEAELGGATEPPANPEKTRGTPKATTPAVPNPEDPDNSTEEPEDPDLAGEFDEEDDSSADGAGDPDEAEAEPEEGGDAPEEPSANPDEDLPPEHYKKLPAWAQKRLGNQAAALKTLRSEIASQAVTITPTAASPLAHIEQLEDLQEQVDLAKAVKEWVRANPDGGMIGRTEVTPEQAQAKLAHAESVLEAAPDWKTRLTARAQAKPWEQALEVCPQLFTKGSEENQFAVQALQMCPELKTRLPNWEMFLAAAVRTIKQISEEKAGKAKYVRMELDKDGKVVAPQKPAATQKPGTKPAPNGAARPGQARPPVTPGGTAPPLRPSRGGKPDTAALEERYQKTRDPDDFASLVAAEMASA